jgi:CheY-like chemotaxis protein
VTVAPPLLLVVDDAPEMAFIVRRLGKQAGYEAAACGDVPAAWEYLQSTQYSVLSTESEGQPDSVLSTEYSVLDTRPSPRRPDLILLDLNLPGTPGAELCRRLRVTPELAELRVALYSHWDRADDIAAGLAAGADFVVSKDLLTQPDAWAGRLHEILARAPGERLRLVLSHPGMAALRTPPQGVLRALDQAVRHPLGRQAGPQVLDVLARRSLQLVKWWGTAAADARPPRHLTVLPKPPAPGPDDGMLSGGPVLNPTLLAGLGRPGAVVVFAAALAEQMETVLGTAAAAPLWAALAEAVPGLAETLSRL